MSAWCSEEDNDLDELIKLIAGLCIILNNQNDTISKACKTRQAKLFLKSYLGMPLCIEQD